MSLRALLATLAVLAVATACSSSGGTHSAPPSSPSAGSGTVTISLTSGHLTGPGGRTLYLNSVDTPTHLICTGACLSQWPPVTGTVQAGNGVSAANFGSTTRPDGTMQVTYSGHPLYEFAGDKAAGDTNGQGITDAGGTWSAAKPGAAVSTPSPGRSTSTTSQY